MKKNLHLKIHFQDLQVQRQGGLFDQIVRRRRNFFKGPRYFCGDRECLSAGCPLDRKSFAGILSKSRSKNVIGN